MTTDSSRTPSFAPVLLALLCVGVAIACRPEPTGAPLSTTLKIATSIPQAGDGTSGVGKVVQSLELEAPVLIGWDGRPSGRAFDSWTWLPGHLGLRLHLRPGIRFHDGTLLTSDIAAEIVGAQLVLVSDTRSPSVTSVAADGPEHVLIRTSQPEGLLLSNLSVIDFAYPRGSHIGTGPYRYESAGPPIVLTAFEGYPTGPPAVGRIEIMEYPTPRAAWTAMMRGEANMIHDVSPEAMAFFKEGKSVEAHPFERGYYDALIFNQHHPVLGRLAVRKALSEAIDRQQIVDDALRKAGAAAKGPFWPYLWALPAEFPSYGFDQPSALRRLEAAHLPVRPSTSPEQMPSRFRFECLVVSQDHRLQDVALALQRQLYNIGVDLVVEPVDIKIFRQRLGTGDFESVLTERLSYRSSAYVYDWHSPRPGARDAVDFGYSAADAALERFRAAIDDDEVRAAVLDVQKALYDDPPAVFINWTQRARALTSEFVVPEKTGPDILGSIREWKPLSPGAPGGR